MRCSALLIAAALFVLASGSAGAGEDEYLLMRGDAGDGNIQVNGFFAPDRKTEAPAGPSRSGEYLQWKNHCATAPAFPSDQTGDRQQAPFAFGQVTPYLERRDRKERGYLELLANELPPTQTALPETPHP